MDGQRSRGPARERFVHVQSLREAAAMKRASVTLPLSPGSSPTQYPGCYSKLPFSSGHQNETLFLVIKIVARVQTQVLWLPIQGLSIVPIGLCTCLGLSSLPPDQFPLYNLCWGWEKASSPQDTVHAIYTSYAFYY